MLFHHVSSISGRLYVPGDKSISHRAVMFGAIADGTTVIHHFLQGADCLSTIACFSNLGIFIENDPKKESVRVHGKGLYGLTPPSKALDVGNSGTTMRLISGILSGQPFESILTGDASIRKRPMERIITPLCMMGADIVSLSDNQCAPLRINGSLNSNLGFKRTIENKPKTIADNTQTEKEKIQTIADSTQTKKEITQTITNNTQTAKEKIQAITNKLHGITYHSFIASAQVKSALLLAGLYADNETTVIEPYRSRNHTELMLEQFGASLQVSGTAVTIQPEPKLKAIELEVPGDISSAAYFIAAAAILPNSELVIEQVGVNPTRDGILHVCQMMGVNYSLEQMKNEDFEAVCNIRVCSSSIHGCVIEGALIPTLIDELPIIAVMACFAEGETIIKDAKELKVKESNRIDVMVQSLTAMGAKITATEDGMIIYGGSPLHGAVLDSHLDHRIAMSLAIAALAADGETEILQAECVTISYPTFYDDLHRLCK